ncbi:unnamed protein product [Bursaphelenchus okinawaensis]|uniref:RING-type E3 ubiquitin transferase n=1 Tax=Bursaphelenchus okinawaensis TaxID=465554 RepID=A0A811KU77_9BILA|nr:unnamed protein product [Bursaphelenchus okinawaensis]CAG9112354.1 unnamed protein product [Bursaphelenchus okinawaensis]
MDDDLFQLNTQYPLSSLAFLDDVYNEEYSPEHSQDALYIPQNTVATRARRSTSASTRGRGRGAASSATTTRGRGARGGRGRRGAAATSSTRSSVAEAVLNANEFTIQQENFTGDIVSMQPNVSTPSTSNEVPLKRIRLDSPLKSQNQTLNDPDQDCCCTICYDDFDADLHRLVCLKCGHLFGKSCIIRWIQSERNGNCPTCKTKATVKDIRPLFGQMFKASNGAEFNQLKTKLKEALEQNEKLQGKLKTTEEELEKALKTIATYNELNTVSVKEFKLAVKKLPFSSMLAKDDFVKAICAFDNEDFVVCGCQLMSNKEKCCGIAKIDSTSVKKIALHDKIVRSIHINPSSPNMVASTSDDGTLCITDVSLATQQLKITYKLKSNGWACCWMSLQQVAVGLKNGRVYTYSPGKEPEDITNGDGDKPIMSLNYDSNHRVLFICAVNSIKAYRNGTLYTLLENISIASFCYDTVTGCFLLTIPPVQGKVRTALQLYKVDFQNMGAVKQLGNHQTRSAMLSKNTVNIIWTEPGGQLLCAFFNEDLRFTNILNWGLPDDRKNPEDPPQYLITIKHKPTDHVVHYAQAQKQAPPSATAPCGVQNTLYVVTTTSMFCYCLIYS